MTAYRNIEDKIQNTVELSTICRGEWCRMLESDMDRLDDILHDYLKSGEVNERFCFNGISDRIYTGYRNLSHHVFVLQ